MMQNRQLVINSIYYTLGELLPRVVGFFLLPLLTRYLSPAEYGINSYTTTVMLFSGVVSVLSLNTFLLRNYYKEKTPEAQRRIIGNIFLLTLLTNTGVTLLELLLFPRLLTGLKIGIPFYPYFLLAIGVSFLDTLSVIPMVIYRIRQQAWQLVTISGAKVLCQFGLTFVLLQYCHWGLTGVYLARLFTGIPFALFFLYIVWRNAEFKLNKVQSREALRFSLPLLPGMLSYLFVTTFDRIVLEKNVGLGTLGLYSTAATLALALSFVVQGLYRAMEPRIFEKHGSPDYARVTDELFRYFIAVLLGTGFMISLFSREIFLFFTSAQFRPAYTLVPALIVPLVLNGLVSFFSVLLIADYRQKVITRGTMLSLAVTLPATLILIRLMGVYGAILSSFLAFGVLVSFYLYRLRLPKNYAFQWVPLLLAIPAICRGMDLTGWNLPAMIPAKLGLSAGYLGLCAWCFRIKIPKWNRAAA